MSSQPSRLAPLAGPLIALGIVGTAAVAFHGDGRDPTPIPPMVALVLGTALLRTRSARVRWFLPLCIAAFPLTVRWDLMWHRKAHDVAAMLVLQVIEGTCFAILLLPLLLASVRRSGEEDGTAGDRSRRRSPWVVAAGIAAPLGALSRFIYNAWPISADIEEPRIHHRWEQGAGVVAIAALGAAVVLTAVDLIALVHTFGARRASRADPGAGSDRRALAASVAIDLGAIAVAAAFVVARIGLRAHLPASHGGLAALTLGP